MTIEEVNTIIDRIKSLLRNKQQHTKLRLKTLGFHGTSMEAYKSWDEVFASMREHPECTKIVDVKCPTCKQSEIRLWYSAQQWAWQNLMGDGGFLRIYPHCGTQIRYKMILMN